MTDPNTLAEPVAAELVTLPAYRPTAEEWEHLSNALSGYMGLMARNAADATTPEGRAAAQVGFDIARELLGRLNQIVRHGQGVPPKVLEFYQKRIEAALTAKDFARVEEGYADLLAAATRMEPNPARWCAKVVIALVGQAQVRIAVEDAREVACEALLGEHGVLGELAALQSELGTLTAAEVVGYLKEWVESGLANAKAGLEPWPKSGGEGA